MIGQPSIGGHAIRDDRPVVATTKAQRHKGFHKERPLVFSFVSSCLGGCDGDGNDSEEGS